MYKVTRKQAIFGLLFIFFFLFALSNPSFAGSTASTNKIMNSTLFKGLVELIKDLTEAASYVSGVLAVLVIIIIRGKDYFNKNEQEEKETNQRTKIAVRALIIIFTASTLLNLILSYFTTKQITYMQPEQHIAIERMEESYYA